MKTNISFGLINKQQGFTLILFFLILIISGAVFLITHIQSESGRVDSENITTQSLSKAKQALLAYAASYYYRSSNSGTPHAGIHGILPCPEEPSSTAEGTDSGSCAPRYTSSLGRLPWSTLDIPPLKDASGECLWYSLSGGFFNSPLPEMINHDTPGMFMIYNKDGSLIQGATPESRVAAIIIAPGKPLSSQNRQSADSSLPCKVARDNVQASDYLDTLQWVNNSSVNTLTADLIEDFVTSEGLIDDPQLNDRLITITTDEIFDVIKSNKSYFDDKITQLGLTLSQCLIDYAVNGATNSQSCSSLSQCYASCTDEYNLCVASGQPTCNKTRNVCRKTCRDQCIKGKPKGGKGGAGTTNFNLPWPAPMELNADYRVNTNYTDITSTAVSTEGLLGRLPLDLTNSSAMSGNSATDLFSSCGIDLSTPTEMSNLWQNWKDHWFYVVGSNFSPGATNATPCINCPRNNNGSRYAAMLIFASERLANQFRQTNEAEDPDPAFSLTKSEPANYLEGSNLSNYPDINGNKNYGLNIQNDRLFCIPTDMSSPIECP